MTRFRWTKLDLYLPVYLPVKSEDDQQEVNRKSGLAYAAAFSLFAAVVGGLIIGWLLDRWLGTRPWLLVTGIVLGSAAGFYELIRSSSKLS
jgi:ATP synthase protein I